MSLMTGHVESFGKVFRSCVHVAPDPEDLDMLAKICVWTGHLAKGWNGNRRGWCDLGTTLRFGQPDLSVDALCFLEGDICISTQCCK